MRRLFELVGCMLCCVGVLAVGSGSALAVTGGPQWTVAAVSEPTNLVPGDESGDQSFDVIVTNSGGTPSDPGEPVTVTDVLPEGVVLDPAGAEGFELRNKETPEDAKGTPMSCVGTTCTFARSVIPQEMLLIKIPIDVELTSDQTVTNLVHVFGGGAPDAFARVATTVSSTPAGFGIAPGSATASLSDSQAGAHADLTSTIGFDTVNGEGELAGDQKETYLDLPPGFGGDLVDTPTCPVAKFDHEECPIGTQIGVATIMFEGSLGKEVYTVPVYDLAPEPGDVAKIGIFVIAAHAQADVTVLPGDYALRTTFHNINALVRQDFVSVTVWGVPSEAAHNAWRWNPAGGVSNDGAFGVSSINPLVPFLSSPTSCSNEPLQATFASKSWQEPEAHASEASPLLAPISGCDRLGFLSTFTAVPTSTSASAPTGLDVELGVHQTNEDPGGLAASALQKAIVTLPEGMTVNPSAGAGLGACTQEEYEEQEEPGVPVGRGCPSDSKLGSVKIKTPALNEEGSGSVYIAQPYANPFSEYEHPTGSLIALYVVARFPVRGVVVKVAGKVSANPLTGRLITVFEGTPLKKEPSLAGLPPVPFSLFTFSFRQGETSPLVTPPTCGLNYTVEAELTPWSDPGEVLTDLSQPFAITSSFDGGSCPSGGAPPFQPRVSAGTLNNDAGSYSPFDIRIVREDGEQEITGFSSQLPPGLTADLSGIPFCSEADIALARGKTGAQEEAEPSCPVASQIGHTLVGAGVGEVLAYTPGKIYMAGSFEGAPFSIVAITAAKVGPFDLGTVVVHLPLQINPVTAAVSVPAGAADQIPHIIDGIVIHVRDIRVYIDRPDFMINPTNCTPMGFSATVIGSGASFTDPADDVPVTVPDSFQAADCASLAFKPTFKVSTSGKTSKANGASLTVKLTYPNAPQGTQANVAKVKVELPKQLPSRLTTLQKACPESTFNANPANCPTGSIVGMATAITPIIPVPLTGPAYFVSHGGAKFPELVIVLQGYGVTLDLHGETFISKKGITTSTFASVPDAPVGSFELKLPQGPDSALAANGNLCKEKLTMPTIFTAQNGAVIHQTTKLIITGCPKKSRHVTHKHAKNKKPKKLG
jgi:uncharacterized repeat protein (TIGR01451 family)